MNEDRRKSLAHELLRNYIADNNLRRTPERFAILDKIMEGLSRFTMEELCDRIEAGDFRVSRATIYNTVNLLSEAGIIRRLHLQTDVWEISVEPVSTVRLVCRKCGKVREVVDRQLARTFALKRYQSFTHDGYEVCITGYCTKCRPKEYRTRK